MILVNILDVITFQSLFLPFFEKQSNYYSIDYITKKLQNINDNNEKITHIINNFSNISDSIAQANIKQTIDNTNKALSQANVILDQIAKGQGTVGKLMYNDSLYVHY